MSIKFEASKKSGIHSQFQKMTGAWEGTTKTWFEPDKIADESPIYGSIKLLLDGRFLLHEYKSRFGDKPLEGIAIYGYHLETGKFQSAWIDSFHNGTAIMFSEGEEGLKSLKCWEATVTFHRKQNRNGDGVQRLISLTIMK